jgi:hypothetical protein
MRHFIIKTGYSPEDFISINETELEKAIYAHLTGMTVALENGTISGKNIISIKEDWHKAMGWNRGHRLTAEDFEEIENTCKSYKGLLSAAKSNVVSCMNTGRVDLIGTKPLEVKTLSTGMKSLSELIKKI